MGALGFLGGFSTAASQAAAQGSENKLQSALAAYRIKHELDDDALRRAYLLSRLNKPGAIGTGLRLTNDKNQDEIFYPQTGAQISLPQGYKFAGAKTGQSGLTKSFYTFIAANNLDEESYRKLPPAQKMALYQRYVSTLRPDEALKEKLDMMRADVLAQQLKIMPLEARVTMDIMKEGAAGSSGAPSIILGTPTFDPSDPSTFGGGD